MPLTNYAFSELITFTRTTTATVVGSNGLIQSVAINAPRFDYDPVTLAPRGILIEEQRTNLLLNSLIAGTSLATQNVTVAAVAHTFSFYGNGTVTLTGAHVAVIVGTGAYPARTTLTFTPTAGTLTVTVVGTVQFANLEAGAFATSYIPTVASQVTRTADQASIVAPMFSPWYNQTEGTITINFTGTPSASASMWFSSAIGGPSIGDNDGGDNVRVGLRGVAYTDTGGTPTTAGVQYKTAYGYKQGDYASSTNGGTVQTSALATAPTFQTSVSFGSTGSVNFLNGYIRRITYYPVRLTNAQLQALTA